MGHLEMVRLTVGSGTQSSLVGVRVVLVQPSAHVRVLCATTPRLLNEGLEVWDGAQGPSLPSLHLGEVVLGPRPRGLPATAHSPELVSHGGTAHGGVTGLAVNEQRL